MSEKLTVKEAAMLWGLSTRRITGLCKEGKIEGAEKKGKVWLIPVNAEKPADNRIKSGAYIKEKTQVRLPLPIGISDYSVASTEYFYVDKTMMIKEFLDERPCVSLFTRPPRFGKTLNMDMLRTFFEKTDEDTSVYFKQKKIWKCGEKYCRYQGKYPVIFISFKDAKKNTWEEAYESITQIIILEFKRHAELSGSRKVIDKKYYRKVTGGKAERNDMEMSLLMLSKMLHEHYGIAPIIIIDDYDTPIQQGHLQGFYDKVISFMSDLFLSVFKDNKHLSYGFITGVLKSESVFNALNNLTINTVFDNKYSEYFGFTPVEIKAMAKYYNAEDKYDEIYEWYGGYQFGKSEIFNPWSVINYFRNECAPSVYWQSTCGDDIIGKIVEEGDSEACNKLTALMSGGYFLACVGTVVIYPQIKSNPSLIYSFLLVAGYLKKTKSELSFNGNYMCEVSLPNKEISFTFTKEILKKSDTLFPHTTMIAVREAVFSENFEKLRGLMQILLEQSVRFYDTQNEIFYHMLTLGLCALFSNAYVTFHQDLEDGYDIQLTPKDDRLPLIIIKLKAEKDCDDEKLEEAAKSALKKITEKKFDKKMSAQKNEKIYSYGVAFNGEKVKVAVEDSSSKWIVKKW